MKTAPMMAVLMVALAAPAFASAELDAALADAQELSRKSEAAHDEIFELSKSMIPMVYAGPTVSAFCGIPPESASAAVRKQIDANNKVLAELEEGQRAVYLAEVRLFQEKMRRDWDAQPQAGRDKDCADIR